MQRTQESLSAKTVKESTVERETFEIPPDPEGLNELGAARAEKVITLFRQLSHCERKTAVRDLLHDIMHLCDRDPMLGKFNDEMAWAYLFYQDTLEDSVAWVRSFGGAPNESD